jgi:DNA-binding response OmpR family regulator
MTQTPGAAPSAKRGRALILIVEDDANIGSALSSILTRKGCDVIHVRTLRDGLAALSRRPDHVILDLMLPDGDGIELLRGVRQGDANPRVVVTTALTDASRLRDVQLLRPHRILRKPLDLVDLLDAIGMM